MLIITGCGRSGTTFASKLFQIEHEPEGKIPTEIQEAALKEDWEAVCSWIDAFIERHPRQSNSYLAPMASYIQRKFPQANIIHLVRDPRDVVRSLMERQSIDDMRLPIPGFHNFDRFTKACYYWSYTNKMLRKLDLQILRLEDLNGTPVNEGNKTFPPYLGWTDREQKIFKTVCGPEMIHYNYTSTAMFS